MDANRVLALRAAKKWFDDVRYRLSVPITIGELFVIASRAKICPACEAPWDGDGLHILNAVMHLNDDHRWSREAIAAWLDSLDINPEIRHEH